MPIDAQANTQALPVAFRSAFIMLAGLFAASAAFAQSPPGADSTTQRQAQAEAVPTEVVVQAIAQDAKVIQSSVGGARVTIRNAETGEVLAEGVQEGGSGSTEKIMHQPHVRGESPYATEDAARFEAALPLSEPTRVEVTAEGPLAFPQAVQRAQATLLLVPGEHLRGDGALVLPLRGFIVEVLKASGSDAAGGGNAADSMAAASAETASEEDAPLAVSGDGPVRVRARAEMLCGCPTTPGGLWDSRSITVKARLLRADGTVAAEVPLSYAGEPSTYEGRLGWPEEAEEGGGNYELQVLATDAEKANFGSAQHRVAMR